MAFKNLNQDNPLAKYRIANFNKSWSDISKELGVHDQHVMRITKYDTKKAGTLKLENVIAMFSATGCDFVDYFSNGKYRIVAKEE